MKTLGLTYLSVATTILSVLFAGFSAAQAAPASGAVTVKVKVEAKPEPSKAIGIVLSAGEALQINDTTIEKVGDKLYDISFKVDASALSEDSVATAMAFNSNGDVVFANVTPALLSSTAALVASIPNCPPEDPSLAIQFNHFGPLQQLVDVRIARSELLRSNITSMLTPELTQRLTQLETALGLSRPEPLSSSLPPSELVDRLTRLDHALKKYKSFKTQ
jgi:hypothetical protein